MLTGGRRADKQRRGKHMRLRTTPLWTDWCATRTRTRTSVLVLYVGFLNIFVRGWMFSGQYQVHPNPQFLSNDPTLEREQEIQVGDRLFLVRFANGRLLHIEVLGCYTDPGSTTRIHSEGMRSDLSSAAAGFLDDLVSNKTGGPMDWRTAGAGLGEGRPAAVARRTTAMLPTGAGGEKTFRVDTWFAEHHVVVERTGEQDENIGSLSWLPETTSPGEDETTAEQLARTLRILHTFQIATPHYTFQVCDTAEHMCGCRDVGKMWWHRFPISYEDLPGGFTDYLEREHLCHSTAREMQRAKETFPHPRSYYTASSINRTSSFNSPLGGISPLRFSAVPDFSYHRGGGRSEWLRRRAALRVGLGGGSDLIFSSSDDRKAEVMSPADYDVADYDAEKEALKRLCSMYYCPEAGGCTTSNEALSSGRLVSDLWHDLTVHYKISGGNTESDATSLAGGSEKLPDKFPLLRSIGTDNRERVAGTGSKPSPTFLNFGGGDTLTRDPLASFQGSANARGVIVEFQKERANMLRTAQREKFGPPFEVSGDSFLAAERRRFVALYDHLERADEVTTSAEKQKGVRIANLPAGKETMRYLLTDLFQSVLGATSSEKKEVGTTANAGRTKVRGASSYDVIVDVFKVDIDQWLGDLETIDTALRTPIPFSGATGGPTRTDASFYLFPLFIICESNFRNPMFTAENLYWAHPELRHAGHEEEKNLLALLNASFAVSSGSSHTHAKVLRRHGYELMMDTGTDDVFIHKDLAEELEEVLFGDRVAVDGVMNKSVGATADHNVVPVEKNVSLAFLQKFAREFSRLELPRGRPAFRSFLHEFVRLRRRAKWNMLKRTAKRTENHDGHESRVSMMCARLGNSSALVSGGGVDRAEQQVELIAWNSSSSSPLPGEAGFDVEAYLRRYVRLLCDTGGLQKENYDEVTLGLDEFECNRVHARVRTVCDKQVDIYPNYAWLQEVGVLGGSRATGGAGAVSALKSDAANRAKSEAFYPLASK